MQAEGKIAHVGVSNFGVNQARSHPFITLRLSDLPIERTYLTYQTNVPIQRTYLTHLD